MVDVRTDTIPMGTFPSLQNWPLSPTSPFSAMAKRGPQATVFRPSGLLGIPRAAMTPQVPGVTLPAVRDAIGITGNLPGKAWYFVIFMRVADQRPFSDTDMHLLERMRPHITYTIEFGCLAEAKLVERPRSLALTAFFRDGDKLNVLTRTEREVFDYLLTDATEKQVASALHRSPHTIHVHVKNIYRKLNVNSRRQLIDLFESSPALTEE